MEPVVEVETKTTMSDKLSEHSLTPVAANDAVGAADDQDILPNDPEDEDRDLMGHSVLNNMEINMVHVFSVEF